MTWLWVVLGIIAAGLVLRLLINLGVVARRVRKLSKFAYERRPDMFREPLRGDVLDIIDGARKMRSTHFDLAVLYLLMGKKWGPTTAEEQAVALEVLRAWDSRYELDRVVAEHGGEVPLDSPDATEVLRLMVEAGEAELPPVIRDFKVDTSHLAPPVASWKQCPQCGGLLRSKRDAVLCPGCTRVWCDPYRWPALDEDGNLIGTQRYAPSATEIDQGTSGRVSAWFLTGSQ